MTKYDETRMLVESVGMSGDHGKRLILADMAKSLAIIADFFAGLDMKKGDDDEHKSVPV